MSATTSLPTETHNQNSKQSSEIHTIQSLNHLNTSGEAHMVSIANKVPTSRSATATTLLLFSHRHTFPSLDSAQLKKGDAIAVARIAGIQAAKKTSDLIPLAHPSLAITGMNVEIEPFPPSKDMEKVPRGARSFNPKWAGRYGGVLITATVNCEGKTGVEMEALTAASLAGLAMYDMLKGVDKAMYLTNTRVLTKSGGKSGSWRFDYGLKRIVREEEDQRTRQKQLLPELEEQQNKKQSDITTNSTDRRDSAVARHVRRHIAARQHELDHGCLVPARELRPERHTHEILENASTAAMATTTGGEEITEGEEMVLVKRGQVTAADLATARLRRRSGFST